jgi:dTDP-4-dehydrorhamnose 3,5-epimerase
MLFTETSLSGSFVIEPEKLTDERGFFARTWCRNEFENHGLNTALVQCNMSYTINRGTLRGMHYQTAPHGEAKLVKCTRGSIYDVIIDMRPGSETYKRWFSVELSSNNYKMLYVPEEFAHGFLTLEDNTEVFYQMSEFYYPDSARGIRWNDPAFSIDWPGDILYLSDRDRNYPDSIISER